MTVSGGEETMGKPINPLSFIKCGNPSTRQSEVKEKPKVPTKKSKKWRFDCWIFLDQLINSLIVGAIAGVSVLAASQGQSNGLDLEAAIIAFGLSFLIKLKEYRNIEDTDD